MNTIYDVGAHKGEDTDFYLRKGFKVIAIEANPILAQKLREMFDEAILSGKLTVVEAAVADEDGEAEFFLNELSVWGTIRENWAERNLKMGKPSRKIRVPALSFKRLLEQYGTPYYLKIDIEGADMLCVRALANTQARPRFLSIESSKTSWAELLTEFNTLERLGYRRFKIVNQAKVPDQTEPNPVGEGIFVNHRFPPDSSGLFGNDLPGAWLTRRQALIKYAFIFVQYKLFGDNTLGQRIANRMPFRLRSHLIPDWFDTHAAHGAFDSQSPASLGLHHNPG